MTATEQGTRHDIPSRLDVDAAVPAYSKAMSTSRHDGHARARSGRLPGRPARPGPAARLPDQRLRLLRRHARHRRRRCGRAGAADQRRRDLERVALLHRPRARGARFTEVVTRVADTRVPKEEYDAVAAHWSPDEVGALLALIVTINAWNALSVATRAWEPTLAD